MPSLVRIRLETSPCILFSLVTFCSFYKYRYFLLINQFTLCIWLTLPDPYPIWSPHGDSWSIWRTGTSNPSDSKGTRTHWNRQNNDHSPNTTNDDDATHSLSLLLIAHTQNSSNVCVCEVQNDKKSSLLKYRTVHGQTSYRIGANDDKRRDRQRRRRNVQKS